MAFRRISILGVGLMGGSLGMACRAKAATTSSATTGVTTTGAAITGATVTGFSPRPEELKRAVERGAIDQGVNDPAVAVEGADLVVLCVPVGLFELVLKAIAPALKAGAIVTDVGSTKRSIERLAGQILPETVRFVGSHPMVGGEKHGIEHARADLLEGGVCIVTGEDRSAEDSVAKIEAFWQGLGMRTLRMSADRHDELTAQISHLPHALAAALVRMQSPDSLAIAARGFMDSTRIAAGDSGLWRDILLENRDYLKTGIVRIQQELNELLVKLEAGDAHAVQAWLAEAAKVRQGMGRAPQS